MSLVQLYRDQAAQQKSAAAEATLENVRQRCERAAAAWDALATRSERAEVARAEAAAAKPSIAAGNEPGTAAAPRSDS